MECLICGTDAKFGGSNDRRIFECRRCGEYQATEEGWAKLNSMRVDVPVVSGWIREQNASGVTPRIDLDRCDQFVALRRPNFKHRIERYLITVVEQCPGLGMDFDPFAEHLIGASYSSGQHELEILVNFLVQKGLLWSRMTRAYWINPQGHIEADELRTRRAKSSQAFVAMWFAPEMTPVYDSGLSFGIENAGYKSMRVDKKEHANKIDDEIIAEIRRSAFLVADFTEHRGGVYFEAGFAMGLGLPVIWTCRKDHIKDLHFDIRQYNCIDWADADELGKRLQQRIEAMFGRGPLTGHQ